MPMTARVQTTPDPVADGVWRLTLGMPLKTNVFFIREDDGVAVFDAGSKPMGPKIRRAADALGGATRVIIGNAHADHRGGARAIGAPVHCHLDERADMEGDGGEHYFDFAQLPFYARPLTPRLMRSWDDGPLQVSKTLVEGDKVGEGFEVIHLPGHAPGCANVRRHPLESHDRNGARGLGDTSLLGIDHVHDHAAPQHLGQSALDAEGAGGLCRQRGLARRRSRGHNSIVRAARRERWPRATA